MPVTVDYICEVVSDAIVSAVDSDDYASAIVEFNRVPTLVAELLLSCREGIPKEDVDKLSACVVLMNEFRERSGYNASN